MVDLLVRTMTTLTIKDRCKLVIYALGVFVSYFVFGFFQQKIYDNETYGEKFEFSSSFVVVQCLVYFLIAKAVIMTHDHPKNETPHKFYIFTAIFILLAQVTSNLALQYIEFVVQVVGKSCKPIAVMIFGVLFARKTYRIQKYVFVGMIVLAVGIFLYNGNHKANAHSKPLLGNILVAASLIFEGLLGAAQDKMRIVSKPTALNFMFFVNFYSMLFGIPMMLVNNEGVEFVKFCMRHNAVIVDMLMVIVCGTIGQFFITAMVAGFGSLPLSIVTTIRKFCTAVFSAIVVKKVLNEWQWLATVIIFTALILDVLFGKKTCCGNTEDETEKSKSLKAPNTVPQNESKLIV